MHLHAPAIAVALGLAIPTLVACGSHASETTEAAAATSPAASAEPARRGLVIDLSPVAWTRITRRGEPAPPPGTERIEARQSGSHVEVTCGPAPSITVTDEGGPSQVEPVAATSVCAGLGADPALLVASPDPASCPDLRYWDLTVRVSGEWDGGRVAVEHTSCDPWAGDVATRWATLLGMQVAGPDIW